MADMSVRTRSRILVDLEVKGGSRLSNRGYSKFGCGQHLPACAVQRMEYALRPSSQR